MRRLSVVVAAGVLLTPAALALPVLTRPAPAPRPVPPHVYSLRVPTAHSGRSAAALGPTATKPFDAVGVTWRWGTGTGTDARVRVRQAGGWTGWYDLGGRSDSGPDARSPDGHAATVRDGTEPLFTGPADGVQVSVSAARAPADIRVVLVDPGRSPADAGPPAAPAAVAQAAAPAPAIITRAQWGADEALRYVNAGCGQPSYAPTVLMEFVHHTDTSNSYSMTDAYAQVRSIYAYHVLANGWCDIGYNFLVDRYGRVFEGRYGGVTRAVIGAHTGGFNYESTGVALLGTFSSVSPTAAMVGALERLSAWKLGLTYVDPTGRATLVAAAFNGSRWPAGTHVAFYAISGHRDADYTECPGSAAYPLLPSVRSEARSMIGAGLVHPSVNRTVAEWGDSVFGFTVTSRTLENQDWVFTVTSVATGVIVRKYTGVVNGAVSIRWRADDQLGAAVPPGDYRLELQSYAGRSVAVPYVQTVFIRPPTPAAVSPADGEVDLFFTTSAGSVEHQVWVPGQGWSAAQALPGVTAVDGPAAVVLPGTGLQVLVRGRDNALWSDILTSVGPSGWVRLGGQLTSSPSAVVDQSGAVRVFARATNATVQTAVLSGTTPAWSGIGGVVVGAPTAGMLAPGQVSVYATGSDGKIRERTLSSSGWSAGWTVVQSGTDTTPALVLMPSTGVADLLVRGTNAALWVSERPPWSTLWSPWAHLGETLADGVTALAPSTDTLAVYAVAGTGALWGRDRVGSTWSSWYTVPTGTTWPVR